MRSHTLALILLAGIAPTSLARQTPTPTPTLTPPPTPTPAPAATPEPTPAPTEPATAEPKPEPAKAVKPGVFSGLTARNLGPAIMSGRISDLAVNPERPAEWYVAVASGGVWKTTNAGTTFSPIFEGYGSFSIGCVTLDPTSPSTVWVGTGENNSQRSVSWGDGVYVSRDAGKSFTNVGLKDSAHIGMIRVDPGNPSRVYAAAMGPLWSPGGDRGLYRTNDGGGTWERILEVSENTGVSEVHLDPRDASTLYAVAYQRRRHVWTLINGGPESAIYKSTDAGATWRKVTRGLPGGDKGRIGMCVSPANPDILYATVEAPEGGGMYRSRDRGESWEKRSGGVATSPQYYQELIPDPRNPDRFYSADTFMSFTNDGGATMRRLSIPDMHVDSHALWIDPANTDHLIQGNDGGLYETFDRASWRHFDNLPVMQFYRVGLDNAWPFYNVYGGTQDNSTIGGPSRTTDRAGVTNEDWFVCTGGDGFEVAVDPENPSIVYCESQDGALTRFDRASGEEVSIRPREKPGDKPFVFNWDTPFLISPHKKERLYVAGNFLFRSDDRGGTWTRISEDLTRGLDRNQLKVMGVIQKPEAPSKHLSTSIFGNAVSLTESPLVEGLLYVGTDDGLVHVTGDDGKTWQKAGAAPGVPDMAYVSDLEASRHSRDTVFAAFENHKMGDYRPYLMRSDDRGRTWTSIAGNLPERGPVYTIAEDHARPGLLFCGTEYGAYFSIDGGEAWTKISGLPTIAVRDLEIQRRDDDLAMATFGRGMYLLHDYSPMRLTDPALLEKPAYIFPVKPALSYLPRTRLGNGSGRGWAGTDYYSVPNPPYGAVITLHLKDGLKTLAESRKEAQGKDGWTYPTLEQSRAEDREPTPRVVLTIRDEAGAVVRRLEAPRSAGLHRVVWDLRLPDTDAGPGRGDPDEPWNNDRGGVAAPPGRYTARLSKVENGVETDLGDPATFEVQDLAQATMAAKGQARTEKFEFERSAADLARLVAASGEALGEMEQRIARLAAAIRDTPALGPAEVRDQEALRQRALALRAAFSGDGTAARRVEATLPSLPERIGVAAESRSATSPPTGTQREQLEIARAEATRLLGDLRALEEAVRAFETRVEQAGGPPAPGRLPAPPK